MWHICKPVGIITSLILKYVEYQLQIMTMVQGVIHIVVTTLGLHMVSGYTIFIQAPPSVKWRFVKYTVCFKIPAGCPRLMEQSIQARWLKLIEALFLQAKARPVQTALWRVSVWNKSLCNMNQIKDVLSGAAVFLSHRWRLIGNVLDFLQPQKAYRLCVTIKQILL